MTSYSAIETQTVEQTSAVSRPPWLPLLFLPAVGTSMFSWMSDGNTVLTDAAFVLLALACVLGLVGELRGFSRRFGVGGLVLFGGTLVWYCHDYFSNWFATGKGYDVSIITPVTVAKAAFCTSLFIMMASIGLLIRWGRKIEEAAGKIPEPANQHLYFVLAVVFHCIGLLPYFVWAQGNPFASIISDLTAMRTGTGTQWLTGRTGNLNYSWGGYIVHFFEVGWLGAILGMAYALFVSRGVLSKVCCWLIWLFWLAINFGTGTRGYIVAVGLPVLFMIFIRYHIQAAAVLSKFSLRAYLYAGAGAIATLALIQFQGTWRSSTSEEWRVEEVDLMKAQGNHMFSEGLLAYQLVPDTIPHPSITFFGAGFVRPIPDIATRFAIGWIPRAIWKSKPGFSEFGAMYNLMMSGGTAENTTGATVCPSVAGGAYIACGIPGVIEVGLLFGWLCALSERIFVNNKGKLIVMLFGLGLATWMFRCFRDLSPHDLYPLLIGMAVFVVFSLPLRSAARPVPVPS